MEGCLELEPRMLEAGVERAWSTSSSTGSRREPTSKIPEEVTILVGCWKSVVSLNSRRI